MELERMERWRVRSLRHKGTVVGDRRIRELKEVKLEAIRRLLGTKNEWAQIPSGLGGRLGSETEPNERIWVTCWQRPNA